MLRVTSSVDDLLSKYQYTKKYMKKLPILYSLIGTIIGASFFSLPFVFNNQNFLLSCILFLLISIVSLYTNYLYSKIIVDTHSQHQLPGYSAIYLGQKYKDIVSIMLLLGSLGSNLAYIIIIISFVKVLLPNLLNVEEIVAILFVTIFGLSTLNTKLFNSLEKYLTSLLILLLFFLSYILLTKTTNYSTLEVLINNKISFSSIPLLLGITLAANTGFSILPDMKNALIKSNLKQTIIINSAIPIILYLGFIIAVLVNSNIVSENALSGLLINKPIIILAAMVGLLAVTTSYQSLSVTSIETLMQDFNLSKKLSFFIVIIIPLILFIVGVNQLVLVIGTVGGLFTAFSHLIVYLIYKVKYKSNIIIELFSYILILMIGYEIFLLTFRVFKVF